MPIADYNTYCAMLDNAQKNNFAYAAINITSLPTINGTIAAFAEMKTDGIIQVSKLTFIPYFHSAAVTALVLSDANTFRIVTIGTEG